MASVMSPEQLERLEEFLKPSRIAMVATIGKGGMPQLTPNWYWYDNGILYISTTKERYKYRNLVRDPRLSVCVYSEPLADDYAVMVGTSDISEGPSIWGTTKTIISRYAPADGVDERLQRMRKQNRVLILFRPARVAFRY